MDSCGNRIWATFLGSSGFDSGERLAVSGGNIIVCGYTDGDDFPVSSGAYKTSNIAGTFDCFVTAFNPNGQLVWSTYFGGSGADLAFDIVNDASGNLFFGGTTTSADLPLISGKWQSNIGGALDAFVCKMTPSGFPSWSTYHGGNGTEDMHAIILDGTSPVMAGGTFSNNIPLTANAIQNFNAGSMEIYILKLDSSGNGIFSTYFGGNGTDDAYGIGCDSGGNMFFAGNTNSLNFPITTNAWQTSPGGLNEVYVAKINSAYNLSWCSYFSGNGNESINTLRLNFKGDVFIGGQTGSTNLPILGTSQQSNLYGTLDAFIAGIDSSGIPFYSTYYGGSNDEWTGDLCFAGNHNIAFGGWTSSNDFPVTTGAFQTILSVPNDGFISRITIPSSTTSIQFNENKNSELLMPYPNPCHDEIKFREIMDEVIIYDLAGKPILHQKNCNKIIVESIPSGYYLLQAHKKENTMRFPVQVLKR